jgi:malonyl-CoA O-methyltransferase
MPEEIKILPVREGYNLWSEVYDTDGNPLVAMEEPLVDQLLGRVAGLKVADIGCGTGRHALRLAEAGAEVWGVDFSDGMLERARTKASNGKHPIQFISHDLARPLPFADGFFDRVVCGLVLDHIPDLERFFGELKRICSLKGFLVISVMHPAMMLRGVQARFHDAESRREIRPESFPHSLSDYFMAATGAGLHLDHASEQAVDHALAARIPRAERYLDWPMLFVMRLSRGETNRDIAACNQAAIEGATMFDRIENEDAQRKPR